MSQHIKGADQGYALVKLKCPEGHVLGRVLMQPPSGRLVPMSGPGWTSNDPLSGPLSMRCPDCLKLGRNLDLRGSWEKITEILTETLADPRRGVVSYMLGR